MLHATTDENKNKTNDIMSGFSFPSFSNLKHQCMQNKMRNKMKNECLKTKTSLPLTPSYQCTQPSPPGCVFFIACMWFSCCDQRVLSGRRKVENNKKNAKQYEGQMLEKKTSLQLPPPIPVHITLFPRLCAFIMFVDIGE